MFRGEQGNDGLVMHVTQGVEYHAYLHHGPIKLDGRTCLGICDHRRRIMLIADHLGDAEILGVLCHEYWHAFECEFANFANN